MRFFMFVLAVVFEVFHISNVVGLTQLETLFMCVVNGDISNKAQYESNPKSHRFIQLTAIPVKISSLGDRPFVFVEWSFQNTVQHLLLCAILEDKGILRMTVYNFTDIKKYSTPGSYKIEKLQTLTQSDINTKPGCEADYELVGPTSFLGTFPTCGQNGNGMPDMYSVTYGCDGYKVVIPKGTSGSSSPLYYNLNYQGKRQPVPGAASGYTCPCKN